MILLAFVSDAHICAHEHAAFVGDAGQDITRTLLCYHRTRNENEKVDFVFATRKSEPII